MHMRTLLEGSNAHAAGRHPGPHLDEVYEVYDGPLGEFFKKFEMSEMPTAG